MPSDQGAHPLPEDIAASEVSVHAAKAHLEIFRRHKPLPEGLFDGLPWTEAELRSGRLTRIAWDPYAELLDRMGAAVGSELELEQVGAAVYETHPWITAMLTSVVTPTMLFTFWVRVAPQFWSNLRVELRTVGTRRLALVLGHPLRQRGCRTYYRASVGAVRTIPRRIGLPDCVVERCDVGTHHGVYHLILPEPRTLPARAHRRLETAMRWMQGHIAELDRKSDELGTAQDRLESYARRLELVRCIGARLCRLVELTPFGDMLVDALVDELAYDAARLTVSGEVVASRGSMSRCADLQVPVGSADEPARVEVWGSPEWPDLLEILVPWVRTSITNLRALEAQRALVARVDTERSLLTASFATAPPTWIVGPEGVRWANESGRERLEADPRLVPKLGRVIRGEDTSVVATLIPWKEPSWLITMPDPDGEFEQRAQRAAVDWGLTPAETRVLKGLVQGLSNREMAAELKIREKTVESHLTRIFRKSHAPNRTALIVELWRS